MGREAEARAHVPSLSSRRDRDDAGLDLASLLDADIVTSEYSKGKKEKPRGKKSEYKYRDKDGDGGKDREHKHKHRDRTDNYKKRDKDRDYKEKSKGSYKVLRYGRVRGQGEREGKDPRPPGGLLLRLAFVPFGLSFVVFALWPSYYMPESRHVTDCKRVERTSGSRTCGPDLRSRRSSLLDPRLHLLHRERRPRV
ncbi:hypothetical protein MAPG_07145 [Magnaporthiopsis poae ATCC 64411]|uniref:Uncharacterized protein n=1 Tax=Magnaporthiopsis poae (strain ATCC 64411 / 73-15) TaxID=644358 RepID=A0A0C4E3W8_MAGP6|nr:hypothetical protein MAPG_07145 [Magnaporthiopsis poae ATCC 64411]